MKIICALKCGEKSRPVVILLPPWVNRRAKRFAAPDAAIAIYTRNSPGLMDVAKYNGGATEDYFHRAKRVRSILKQSDGARRHYGA